VSSGHTTGISSKARPRTRERPIVNSQLIVLVKP
jgi:hypothetical protein